MSDITRIAARDLKPGMAAHILAGTVEVTVVRSEALDFRSHEAITYGADWMIEWSDGEIEYVYSTTVTNIRTDSL